jgi:hypothetical protein
MNWGLLEAVMWWASLEYAAFVFVMGLRLETRRRLRKGGGMDPCDVLMRSHT